MDTGDSIYIYIIHIIDPFVSFYHLHIASPIHPGPSSHSQMETGQPAGAAAAIGVRAFLQQGLNHALLVRALPLHLVSDL